LIALAFLIIKIDLIFLSPCCRKIGDKINGVMEQNRSGDLKFSTNYIISENARSL